MSEQEIAVYLEDLIKKYSKLPDNQITADARFEVFGLDSIDLVGMSADLEDHLQVQLSPLVLHEHPNIASLAAYLAGGPH